MILRILLPLAAALASLGAASPLAPLTAEEQVAANTVRAHVEFLAGDRLEGRDTGSRGHEIAADYVAAQFRMLGLEPGGPDGSWFQQVPLRKAITTQPTPAISLVVGGSSKSLRWGVDAALRPSLTERHRSISAPLVFAGFGLDEPLLGLDDYRDLSVSGAIVVVLDGAPAGVPTEVAAHLGSTKAEAAAQHGAIGIIHLSGDGPRGARASDVAGTATQSVMSWIDTSGRTGDSANLRATLTLSPAWQARLFDGAPKSLAAVRAEALAKRRPVGFALPGRMTVAADSSWENFASPAVIGRLPGADPARAADHIVLMAHLDHLGVKTDAKPGEDRIYNGALDNAAGVATMLEAAREFVASGRRPARSVLFIANTGEEKGLLGADYFAAHPTVPIVSIVSVVDLDMPLPLYDFTDVTAFGAEHSTVARTVAQAGAAMGIRVSPDPMPQETIFVRSDHYRFVQKGVPAILLMTGYANGGEAVWTQFMAKVYHSPADDLSQPISWRALARYGMLNYGIARALADAPDRPRWFDHDYFGDRFAPGQVRAPRGSGG